MSEGHAGCDQPHSSVPVKGKKRKAALWLGYVGAGYHVRMRHHLHQSSLSMATHGWTTSLLSLHHLLILISILSGGRHCRVCSATLHSKQLKPTWNRHSTKQVLFPNTMPAASTRWDTQKQKHVYGTSVHLLDYLTSSTLSEFNEYLCLCRFIGCVLLVLIRA